MRFTHIAAAASYLTLGIGSLALANGPGFVENRGQIDERVKFYALGPRFAVYLTDDAIVLDLKEPAPDEGPRARTLRPHSTDEPDLEWVCPRAGCAIYIHFVGARPSPAIEARRRLECRYHFFLGSDPTKWRTHVDAYEEVVYRGIENGMDLVLRLQGADLVYEVVAADGIATPSAAFRYEGATRVLRPDDTEVWVETPVGRLAQRQGSNGRGRFLLPGHGVVGGPTCEGRDDPAILLWSTFLGGSGADGSHAHTLDDLGNPVIVGGTHSPDFPATPGAYDPSHNAVGDVFLAKLSADGSAPLWCTFLGGYWHEWGNAVALDGSGNPVLTGITGSPDFPRTPFAYDISFNGTWDAFVSKLSSDGSALLWSTFLGGSSSEEGGSLAVDNHGNTIVAGRTESSDFPATPGAYDTALDGGSDAFVARLGNTGRELHWCTFLGGNGGEGGRVELVPTGIVVAGGTTSSDFPTTPGAHDRSHNGGQDLYVAKLSTTGSSLAWGTFVGGSADDQLYDFALDASGNAILTGITDSPDFPATAGAYDTSYHLNGDAFVTKLSSTGSSLLWSTFLGGNSEDAGRALALDASGCPVVSGHTYSSGFPITPRAFDSSYNGYGDTFVARLSGTGSSLLWSTFLGGGNSDYVEAIDLDPAGSFVLSGRTLSADFPATTGAYDTSHNGENDAFITRLTVPDISAVGLIEPGSGRQVLGGAPNPMRGATAIRYTLLEEERVALRICDIDGRRILERELGTQPAGSHVFSWDGRDMRGREVRSGVYLAHLQAGGLSATSRLVVLK